MSIDAIGERVDGDLAADELKKRPGWKGGPITERVNLGIRSGDEGKNIAPLTRQTKFKTQVPMGELDWLFVR